MGWSAVTVVGYLCTLVMASPLYLTITSLLKIRRKWWSKPFLYIVSWLILAMVIYIGDWGNLPLTLCVFLLGIWLCCEGSGWKRFVIGLMIASTVFAFNGLIDNVYERFVVPHRWATVGIRIFLKVTYALLLYLLIRLYKPKEDFELPIALWQLLLILTLPSFGIVTSLVLLRSPFSESSGTILADSALFLIAALSFIGLIRAMLVLERQQALEQENTLSRMNAQYYERMEEQNFAIRRLKHDLANHLQTLLALPEGERVVYIQEMLENKELTQTLHYSGDITVNVVLSLKQEVMRQKAIHFVPRIEIAQELPFAKADICALFANALDNAIEACEKLSPKERRICLEAKLGKGLVAVSVRNSCEKADDSTAKTHHLLPETTKENMQNHGFGLKSIREIVKRYEGVMEIQREENEFVLFLYLPLVSGT